MEKKNKRKGKKRKPRNVNGVWRNCVLQGPLSYIYRNKALACDEKY